MPAGYPGLVPGTQHAAAFASAGRRHGRGGSGGAFDVLPSCECCWLSLLLLSQEAAAPPSAAAAAGRILVEEAVAVDLSAGELLGSSGAIQYFGLPFKMLTGFRV